RVLATLRAAEPGKARRRSTVWRRPGRWGVAAMRRAYPLGVFAAMEAVAGRRLPAKADPPSTGTAPRGGAGATEAVRDKGPVARGWGGGGGGQGWGGGRGAGGARGDPAGGRHARTRNGQGRGPADRRDGAAGGSGGPGGRRITGGRARRDRAKHRLRAGPADG